MDTAFVSLPASLFDTLPNELLCHIFSFLSLKDLSECRMVDHRFQDVIDSERYKYLWANAPLLDSCEWVADHNRAIIQRAADSGNTEALIILAVAYIYCEGTSEGDAKGTIHYSNALTATKLLLQVENLSTASTPFSWILFRPPWSSSCTCCKAGIWHQLRRHFIEKHKGAPARLHYLLGKPLMFLEETKENPWRKIATHIFSLGSCNSCPYASFELWKINHKSKVEHDEFRALRELRKLVSTVPSFWDAQKELCLAYASGCYGGLPKLKAHGHLREVFQSSRKLIVQSTPKKHSLTNSSRYILIDWLIEVADMKQFVSTTLHFAVSLIDRYLCLCRVRHSNLQLLGITALLLASRWTSNSILTVRESSWLTENTYGYDEVVRMTGSMLAALHGQLTVPVIPDYLAILLVASSADARTWHLSHYLSEGLLLHHEFGRYSCAHLAACCFLLTRILLGADSTTLNNHLEECSGFTIADLMDTCLQLYTYCLTDAHSVTDNRAIKLQGVARRYGEEFCNESKTPTVSFCEVKERLLKLCIGDQRNSISSEASSEPERDLQNLGCSQAKSSTSKAKLNHLASPEPSLHHSEDSCLFSLGTRSPLRTLDRNLQHCNLHQLNSKDLKWKNTNKGAQVE